MSRSNRIVRDYTLDEEGNPRPENPRANSGGYRSPLPVSPDERYHPGRTSYLRSPSRQDEESIITQIRDPEYDNRNGTYDNRNGAYDNKNGVYDNYNLPESIANGFSSPKPQQSREELKQFDFSLTDIQEKSSYAPSVASASQHTGISGSSNSKMPDFFGHEVFQTVLHNPATAHQLLLFSQSRLCGENMEFLEKVDKYHTLLNQVTKIMFEIHRDFISTTAPSQINLPEPMRLKINKDLKSILTSTLPKMESVFSDSGNEIERLVATDIYPRFVRHQITNSASKALATDKSKYAGLGDCFVLTDPSRADNPIVFASDGFVKVTGYSRNDIIPRNCRFLQGRHTDRSAVTRIKMSLDNRTESLELLLNYKKNGEPFWNLLYTSPLYDSSGRLAFFIGGQINCSTTIHNASDILRILAYSDDVAEDEAQASAAGVIQPKKSGFFSAFRSSKPVQPARIAGMEGQLLDRIERLNLKNQMDEFYTAYSKFIIINTTTQYISFHSAGIASLLYPAKPVVGLSNSSMSQQTHIPIPAPPTSLTNGANGFPNGSHTPNSFKPNLQTTPSPGHSAVGQDIFRFLAQHTLNSLPRDFKTRVKTAMRSGSAVTLELSLCTRRHMGFEKFLTHWTPLKDEGGKVEFVVLTLGGVGG